MARIMISPVFVFFLQGYHARGNMDLARRYRVNRNRYPHYKLKLRGRQEPIDYSGDTGRAESIIQFVSQLSGGQ